MGMGPWHTSCDHNTGVLPHVQILDGPWVSVSRSSLRAIQMHCCHNRRVQDSLGCHATGVQLQGSGRALAVLAHQLPRVVGRASRPEEISTLDSGQARVDPDRNHRNNCIYQSPGWYPLSSHVTTHPPPHPLEI